MRIISWRSYGSILLLFLSASAQDTSNAPTKSPIVITNAPSQTHQPTFSRAPSTSPTNGPTNIPTISVRPTASPRPSNQPTISSEPSPRPSWIPSASPSKNPSNAPSLEPTISSRPTVSSRPSASPSISLAPSDSPSTTPTISALPTYTPTTATPSYKPSQMPTLFPTQRPTPMLQAVQQPFMVMTLVGVRTLMTPRDLTAFTRLSREHVRDYWNNLPFSPYYVGNNVTIQFTKQSFVGITVLPVQRNNATLNDTLAPTPTPIDLSDVPLQVEYQQNITFGRDQEEIDQQFEPTDVALFTHPFIFGQADFARALTAEIGSETPILILGISPRSESLLVTPETNDQSRDRTVIITISTIVTGVVLLAVAWLIWRLRKLDREEAGPFFLGNLSPRNDESGVDEDDEADIDGLAVFPVSEPRTTTATSIQGSEDDSEYAALQANSTGPPIDVIDSPTEPSPGELDFSDEQENDNHDMQNGNEDDEEEGEQPPGNYGGFQLMIQDLDDL